MKPVSQLYQKDSQILAYGQEHFSEIFCLMLLERMEMNLAYLCKPVDNNGNFVVKGIPDVINRCKAVFDRVMQESGSDCHRPQMEPCRQQCNFKGMIQIWLSAQSRLSLMDAGGKDVGLFNQT
jgi:hypothetical protein